MQSKLLLQCHMFASTPDSLSRNSYNAIAYITIAMNIGVSLKVAWQYILRYSFRSIKNTIVALKKVTPCRCMDDLDLLECSDLITNFPWSFHRIQLVAMSNSLYFMCMQPFSIVQHGSSWVNNSLVRLLLFLPYSCWVWVLSIRGMCL